VPNQQLVAGTALRRRRLDESAVPIRVAEAVLRRVKRLYSRHRARLPFHGWHHVRFVRDKGMEFAELNGSDVHLVGVAALVHDLNYLVQPDSSATAGRYVRMNLLVRSGASVELARRVDDVVCEAEMSSRGRDISLEAQALSDADTLFKAVPITPVLLAHRYLSENGITLRRLAHKIIGDQQNAYDEGFYFYNPKVAARYSEWARANLRLWQCIAESLEDPCVEDLVGAIDPSIVDRSTG
jgi:uncharacterized protein